MELKWIDINEKHPKPYVTVLVVVNEKQGYGDKWERRWTRAYYDKYTGWRGHGLIGKPLENAECIVTHWMPDLPLPLRSEGE